MSCLSPDRKRLLEYIGRPEPKSWDCDKCHLCGAEPNVYGETKEDAARHLYSQGWRERTVQCAGEICLVCPNCLPIREKL